MDFFCSRYGQCWKSLDAFDARQSDWDRRQGKSFNPHESCSGHQECQNIDMNMICHTEKQTCQCRQDMKWNDETLECQIFMDVDCSDQVGGDGPKVMSLSSDTNDTVKPEDNAGMEENVNLEFDDSNIYNTTDGNPVNLTTISANKV